MIIDTIRKHKGTAIIDSSGEYNYKELSNQIEKYYSLLQNKISENDVIVVRGDYNFYTISLLLALSKYTVIIVPIVYTTEEDFSSKIKASGTNKIITISENSNFNITLRELKTVTDYSDLFNKQHSGIVLFSSGTTGKPKVMVHDFSNLLNSFTAPRKQRRLVFIMFLMFDHIGGLNTLLSCLNVGTPMVIPNGRNPSEITLLIKTHGVQVLPTSPTFLNLLLMQEDLKVNDLLSLKMITYGTERMPEVLLKKLNTFLPNVKLLQTFGTSETGIVKTQSKSSDSLYFKITDKDVDYKIIEGELYLKTKTSVIGYKGLESNQFKEDGWFATGDLVKVDEEGYIKVIGRINDVINVGGLKVMPLEVEGVINEIDEVLDCTVFSKKNAITGQMVCAKVVLNDIKNKNEIKKKIKEHCINTLEKYKRPAKIIFEEGLQVTSRFKKKTS
ncbi:ANL family adenylate-forming protein [Aquimarina algiphila]|uniref:ANL family adenylate-forming protein n=1 Tax=Aquimarina algiphila TaxID=2047982 RepID=UPI002330B207|nr:fatty acid--CoA ligase family protein [Aquimarina algiphila]